VSLITLRWIEVLVFRDATNILKVRPLFSPLSSGANTVVVVCVSHLTAKASSFLDIGLAAAFSCSAPLREYEKTSMI
jgi:hypothetical protein